MEILLYIIAGIVVIVWIALELTMIHAQGFPPEDTDVEAMLEKHLSGFKEPQYNYSQECFVSHESSWGVTIYKSKYSLFFPYYIEYVGAIPFWYNSITTIESLFKSKETPRKIKQKNKLNF